MEGHWRKRAHTLRTTPVQDTESTGVPKLPEAGVHRPLTQLGVRLEAGGKFGIINWPRCGAEALIGKALGPPPHKVFGVLVSTSHSDILGSLRDRKQTARRDCCWVIF